MTMTTDPFAAAGWTVRRLGVVMAPDPDDPREAWGVCNPACARGPDGELYLFPRLVAEHNVSRVGVARVRFGDGTPVASRNRRRHSCPVIRVDRDEQFREVEHDECDRDDHSDCERACNPSNHAAATLPETAVAAPACFFLHAERGLRSRLVGGDA